VCYPSLSTAGSHLLFDGSNVPNYTNPVPDLNGPPPTPSPGPGSLSKSTATLGRPPPSGRSNWGLAAPSVSTVSSDGMHDQTAKGPTPTPASGAVGGGTASAMSTALNMVKGVMGVGLLTVPWAMGQIGLGPSLALLAAASVVAFVCWLLLCALCSEYNVFSYRDLALILLGRRMASFVDVVLLVFLYLCCTLYVVFVTEFVAEALSTFGVVVTDQLSLSSLQNIGSLSVTDVLRTKLFIATAAVFGVLFPLSLLDRLDSLKYSSFCAQALWAVSTPSVWSRSPSSITAIAADIMSSTLCSGSGGTMTAKQYGFGSLRSASLWPRSMPIIMRPLCWAN